MQNIILKENEKQELLNYLSDSAKQLNIVDSDAFRDKICKKVRHLKKNIKLPIYVSKMLIQIRDLIKVLDSLENSNSKKPVIIAALHYFYISEDKYPDYIPIVGFIDDAYVISVVHEKFRNK